MLGTRIRPSGWVVLVLIGQEPGTEEGHTADVLNFDGLFLREKLKPVLVPKGSPSTDKAFR